MPSRSTSLLSRSGRFVGTFVVLMLWADQSWSQTPSGRDQDLKQLAKLESEFLKDQKAAQQAAAKKFDALIASVARAPGIGASERTSLVKKWTAERDRVLKYDELSPQAELAELGIEYGMRVSEGYRPLSKKYDMLIDECARRGEKNSAEELFTSKQKFDNEHVSGRREVISHSIWEGARHDRDANVTFRLAIGDLTGDVFQGRVEANPSVAGHPIFEVRGTIEGTHLQISTARQLQGKNENWLFDGVVVGKTIFLTAEGAGLRARRGARRGQPEQWASIVVLSKK